MIKLTDAQSYTRRGRSGETLWTPGVAIAPRGSGTSPCGPGVIHAYADPLQAALCDPIHGVYGPTALAYTVTAPAEDAWRTDDLKCWTTQPVTLGELTTLPSLSVEDRIAWAIVLTPHADTRSWAVRWLDSTD